MNELYDLAALLAMSADVARRIADTSANSGDAICDLADQIDDVANVLCDIAKHHVAQREGTDHAPAPMMRN